MLKIERSPRKLATHYAHRYQQRIRQVHPLMQRVHERRVALNISQDLVTERIGCGGRQLGRWERGENWPNMGNFVDLCETLGLDVVLVEREPNSGDQQ